jgi:uncharacterized membrane protein
MSMKVWIEVCFNELKVWWEKDMIYVILMSKWFHEMFIIYERGMCWKHAHDSKSKMIL